MAESNDKTTAQHQTIKYFFQEGNGFSIPDFQRPYNWSDEECGQLWEDIVEFHKDDRNKEDKYFLGTIVLYDNDDKRNIVDGQQRVTSLFLLLRALYKRLCVEAQNNGASCDNDIMNEVKKCIWNSREDEHGNLVPNEDDARLVSEAVFTDKENKFLAEILKKGDTASIKDRSRYKENYDFFSKKIKEHGSDGTLNFGSLCATILRRCIVLPIECNGNDSKTTALRIFSTLNDRGLPLADSDIFKAEIYKTFNKDTNAQKVFINKWDALSKTANSASISIDDVFRCYMHVIRAQNNRYGKEISLRDVYLKGKLDVSDNIPRNPPIEEDSLIDRILTMCIFWEKINSFSDDLCDNVSTKLLRCLALYPNDYWKYPLSAYFFHECMDKTDCDNEGDGDFSEGVSKTLEKFKENLPNFLKGLTAFMFAKFVDKPAVNAVRDPIYKICIELVSQGGSNFICELESEKKDDFKKKFQDSSDGRLAKGMVLLNSYLYEGKGIVAANTTDFICSDVFGKKGVYNKFQVEHICPRKRDECWDGKISDADVAKYGNKIPIDKITNIKGSNYFFSKKKKRYAQRWANAKKPIKDVVPEFDKICEHSEWNSESIKKRSDEITDRIIKFFESNARCAFSDNSKVD